MTEAPPEQLKDPTDHTLHIRIPHDKWLRLRAVGRHKGTNAVATTFTVLAYEGLKVAEAEFAAEIEPS